MSKLLEKLQKTSKLKEAAILSESKFFNEKNFVTTQVPAINIALSGSLDGGFTSGLTMFAGPSKHFKTAFTLLMMKAYLDAHKDAIGIFYDSEFGTPQSYFDSFGIDTTRVLHCPITNLEMLKFDLMGQLDNITRGDKVFIAVDSIGNLASKKEVEDALNEKAVADMSRAKQIKSLFRMVTPVLTLKDIPMVVVNHTYKTQDLFPKDVVSGGCMVAGTKVQMSDGTTKNIEDILVGDYVKTLEGNHMVTATWNPSTLFEGKPECYEVEFEDGSKYTCSDQHLFMKNGKWVEVTELAAGDEVSAV